MVNELGNLPAKPGDLQGLTVHYGPDPIRS